MDRHSLLQGWLHADEDQLQLIGQVPKQAGVTCVLVQEMAVKIVQTILKQETTVGSLEKVDMLFDFIAPLVQDAEGVEEDDDEVSGAVSLKFNLSGVSQSVVNRQHMSRIASQCQVACLREYQPDALRSHT